MHGLSLMAFIHRFKFQEVLCSGQDGFTILVLNISDLATITVSDVNSCCVIHDINKFEAINVLYYSAVDDRCYI